MDKHSKNNGNSGFFFGFILGMAAALLLSTKKGRRILKVILDQGLDKLGNWESLIKDTLVTEKDYIDGDDYIDPPVANQPENVVQPATPVEHNSKSHDVADMPQTTDTPETTTVTKMKTATRRFFRGIKKKS